jgi:hypothetical protein
VLFPHDPPRYVLHEPAKYLVRDKHIVQASDLMVACPKGLREETRGSGTWATVRYARELHKPCLLIFPGGTIKLDDGPHR